MCVHRRHCVFLIIFRESFSVIRLFLLPSLLVVILVKELFADALCRIPSIILAEFFSYREELGFLLWFEILFGTK